MKEYFKKAVTVLGSALMIGSSIAMAAAAAYPAPFVSGGVADAAIVYGSSAKSTDIVAAADIDNALTDELISQGGSDTPTEVSGAWLVETSSDKLEIGESIRNVLSYLTDEELPILVGGSIDNEKGTASYQQFMYFDASQKSGVNYTEDDDDNVGLFFKVRSNDQIARYVLDFTSELKSDVIAGSHAEDIEDEDINFLGKAYTIIKAINKTSTATDCDEELTLLGGSAKGTVGNDEEITVGGRTVSVIVSSATQAQFTVDGKQTSKLNEGDTYRLDDGSYLGVTDITYQDYAGGIQQATFYVGADKIELFNGSAMTVNAQTISDADVEIECTMASGDISIGEIKVNMSAGDDFYVPANGKLSDAIEAAGEDPNVLITGTWDIEFKGLKNQPSENIFIKTTSSDERLEITFTNYDGTAITLPVFFINKTSAGKVEGIYSGEKPDRRLMLGINSTNYNSTLNAKMTKGDLFVLNTANPRSPTNNARTYVVEYKGHDKDTDTDPKVRIKVLGETSDREIALGGNAEANWTLRLGGTTFNFFARTSLATKDQPFILRGQDWVDSTAQGPKGASDTGENSTKEILLRTRYNALINITDEQAGNYTTTDDDGAHGAHGRWSPWEVNVSIDDGNRDGDNLALGRQQIVWINYTNQTDVTDAEVNTKTIKTTTLWITDPSDSNIQTYTTTYGAYIKKTDTSSAPAQFEITVPEFTANPLVYVTTSDAVFNGGDVGAIMSVDDSEITSVQSKNLIVVGGSCVNAVAAKLLGSTTPMCGAAWTTATNVGAGQFLIQTLANPYTSGKVATLVAGYEAADTTKAANTFINSAPEMTSGIKKIYSTSTGEEVV